MKYKIGDIVTLKGYDDLKNNPMNKHLDDEILFNLSNRRMVIDDVKHHISLDGWYNCIYETIREGEEDETKIIFENEIKEEFKLPDELFQM